MEDLDAVTWGFQAPASCDAIILQVRGQRTIVYGPNPAPAYFINKALLEHSQIHLLT